MPNRISNCAGPQVVITGSSRELGFSLARQFVSLGDAVCISGRTPATLEAAAAALRAEFPGCRVVAVQADASKAADVQRLADRAAAELGGIVSGRSAVAARLLSPVCECRPLRQRPPEPSSAPSPAQDIWVCNAGQSQQVKRPLPEVEPQELQSIVDTNLTGAAAAAGLGEQQVCRLPSRIDGQCCHRSVCPAGALLGARAAIARMQRQPGGGKFFFVDGNGR